MTAAKWVRRLLTSGLAMSASSLFASALIRALFRSADVRFVVDDPSVIPRTKGSRGIYIFWHEMMLLPAYTHSRLFTTLISESHDGELIARVYRRLGGEVIRGSIAHGRLKAFREICARIEERSIGIAVDGPRGPARIVPPGVIRIAGLMGQPIIPIGIAYAKCRRVGPARAPIAFPRLGAKAWVVAGRPIAIRSAARIEREFHRFRVQAAMNHVQDRAEKLASGLADAEGAMSLKQLRLRQDAV